MPTRDRRTQHTGRCATRRRTEYHRGHRVRPFARGTEAVIARRGARPLHDAPIDTHGGRRALTHPPNFGPCVKARDVIDDVTVEGWNDENNKHANVVNSSLSDGAALPLAKQSRPQLLDESCPPTTPNNTREHSLAGTNEHASQFRRFPARRPPFAGRRSKTPALIWSLWAAVTIAGFDQTGGTVAALPDPQGRCPRTASQGWSPREPTSSTTQPAAANCERKAGSRHSVSV